MTQNFKLIRFRQASLLLFFSFLLFLGCGKKNDFKQSTDLHLTIRFNDNWYLSDSAVGGNVKVSLYRSRVDMETRIRPVVSGVTDANGQVKFNGLEPFAYFIHASYDDDYNFYDNSRGNNQLTDIMVEGALTVATIPIYYTRPAYPATFTPQYIEILKYDTVGGNGCSRDFFVEMDDDAATPLTYTDTVYYCYDNFNSHVKYTLFNPQDPIIFDPYIYSPQYFLFTLNDTTELGGGVYSPARYYYFYPADYVQDNYYGKPLYPTRIRLWEANPAYSEKNTIDLIITWQ
jgi:hypothetical protein